MVGTSTLATGATPSGVFISGRFIYLANFGNSTVNIIDNRGEEVSGFLAHSGDIGSLQVLTNGVIGSSLQAQSGLTVGGDVFTTGGFGVGTTATVHDILPNSSNSGDLGSLIRAWRNIYTSGTYFGTDFSSNSSVRVLPTAASTFTVATNTFIGTGAAPIGVAIGGRYAYLTDFGSDKLSIVDVASGTAPQLVTSTYLGSGSAPAGVVLQGQYAYTANSGNSSMSVVDVTNPSLPVVLSSTSTVSPTAIAVQGRYAYLSNDGQNTFSVIDISDPTAPFPVTSTYVGTSTNPSGIAVQGRYVYTSNLGNDTMSIVDISNPASPSTVTVGNIAISPATTSNPAWQNDHGFTYGARTRSGSCHASIAY